MRSRTSSSKAVILKKDLTRFAPVWVEYSVVLAVIAWILHSEGSYNFSTVGTLVVFCLINLFYGFVCAMTVFGYLHDSIECNMVHAFPVRRESYFLIHLAAGCLMALVPNTLFCLVMLPLAAEETVFLFLSIMLQYIFFYGLGIFCMLLTGRKFAALTLYGLLNFLAVLIQWAVSTLYLPKLPGIWINEDPFYWCYPIYQFMSTSGTMEQRLEVYGAFGLVALGLILVAFLLYRRRKLEYAGDFLAVKPLTSVFLAALSFACGCVLAAISQDIFGEQPTAMLVIGLLIGYFTGQMLLHKTIKVFQPKRLAGAAAIVAVVLGSMWVVGLDIPGRVYYIPKAENVEKVSISLYDSEWADRYETNDPTVIEDILDLHSDILTQKDFSEGYYGYGSCFLTYEMADGSKLIRWYTVTDTDAYYRLQYYYSQPQFLLDVESFEEFKARLSSCNLEVYGSASEICRELNEEELEKMMELFYSECVEGKMSQGYNTQSYPHIYLYWFMNNEGYHSSISIPTTAEKTHAYCMELWDQYR